MSRYQYTGGGATYPTLNVTVVTGDVVEIDAGALPDASWVAVDYTVPVTKRRPTIAASIESGPAAARPAASAYGQGQWFSTDTASLDYSNGTAWTSSINTGSGSGGVSISKVIALSAI